MADKKDTPKKGDCGKDPRTGKAGDDKPTRRDGHGDGRGGRRR